MTARYVSGKLSYPWLSNDGSFTMQLSQQLYFLPGYTRITGVVYWIVKVWQLQL